MAFKGPNIKERFRIPLMMAPALTIIICLFMGGLLMALLQSLNYMPIIGKTDFSFDAYINIISGRQFPRSLLLTLWISLASTTLSCVLAIACSLVLRRQFTGKRWITFIFQLNVPIPHLVGAIGIMFLFSQSGLLSRIAYALGAIQGSSDFPILIQDKYALGIIMEYVWKTTCFQGIIILAVLQSIGEDYENVARSLGANAWQRFRHVILPLIMPGVLSASVLVLAATFGAFEIPFLLGRTYPAALPVLSYRAYTDVDLNSRPEAMAMSVIISILISILVFLYMKITRTYMRQE
jgi:putative spermidine/putrescine transport system permease protein